MRSPNLVHAADFHVTVAPAHEIGPVAEGIRHVIPITGGRIQGPLLNGEVLPGGDDWAVIMSDGNVRVSARYVIKLDDGALVAVRNEGICRPVSEEEPRYAGETVPRFEVSDERYKWLVDRSFVCTFEATIGSGFVDLRFFLME